MASIALLSVLGEGSLTCGSLWGFYVLHPLLKGLFFLFFLTLVEGLGQRMSHLVKALWDKMWFLNMGYTNKIWFDLIWFDQCLPVTCKILHSFTSVLLCVFFVCQQTARHWQAKAMVDGCDVKKMTLDISQVKKIWRDIYTFLSLWFLFNLCVMISFYSGQNVLVLLYCHD